MWKHKTIGNDPILNARHPNIETGYNKFEKLPSAHQHIARPIENTQEVPPPPDQSSWGLVRKVKDWKAWAYTDGSCQSHQGKQVIGAGVYHPLTSTSHFVEPNGEGITNNSGRAELAGIAAAILHGYSDIATDSLTSLQQIEKELLSPECYRHYVQRDILQVIVKTIQNSPTPKYLFRI